MANKTLNEYERTVAIQTLHVVEDLLCTTVMDGLRAKLTTKDLHRCRRLVDRTQNLRREIVGYAGEPKC